MFRLLFYTFPVLILQITNCLASANNPCADVRNGQFICIDCKTLAFCKQEAGNWITIEYAACDTAKSMYCNEETKSCNLQRECLIPKRGIKFECQNPGTYPDPYDCKTYHTCNSLNEDERKVCTSGTIYSVAEKNCIQRSTDSDLCRQAQYKCDYVGMMGAWPGDDNIYYICDIKNIDGEIIYYPLMYRCQTGKIFNGQDCVLKSNPVPPSGSAQTSESCADNKLNPNPSNCRSYYRCSNGKLIAEQCPTNTYFNTAKLSCEFGSC